MPGSKPPYHQVPLGEVLRGWGPLTPFRLKSRAAGPSRPPPQCWRDPRCTNTHVQRSHPTRTNHPSTHQGEGSPCGGTMAIICPVRTVPGSTKDNQRCSTERGSGTEGQEPHTLGWEQTAPATSHNWLPYFTVGQKVWEDSQGQALLCQQPPLVTPRKSTQPRAPCPHGAGAAQHPSRITSRGITSVGLGTNICTGLPIATRSWDTHPAPTHATVCRLAPTGPAKLPGFGWALLA